MEDGTDAAQDGRGDDGAVAEEQQLHGEDELLDCNSMEVDNVVEHGNSGKSFESASGEHEHLTVNENPEVPGSGEVPMDEDEFPPPKDDGAVESCSDSGAFVRTLPEGKAEDEKCKEELSGRVPAVLSFAERVELENDSSPGGDVHDEESAEAIMEEIFVSKNDGEELNRDLEDKEKQLGHEMELQKQQLNGTHENDTKPYSRSFLLNADDVAGDESGTEEEQAAFMKELETFHRERCLEFKPPKFYQEPLNCLKLWRAVVRLGGYEQVTSLKQWRQVGESFKPPKTCTTVSWTFRGFYEKALLEYEKYKMHRGELPFTDASSSGPASGHQVDHNHASGSGRARRDAAARAMQGWHSQRLLGNGEVGDPIVKDKNPVSTPKREKQLRNIGFLKRNGSSHVEQKVARASKLQMGIMVMDVGIPADWVKVNVQRTKDCYEVYALVPGLLREEVRVQSDPAGRLVISGQPEERDNPWGVTPFKKIVSLPTRIDPHQTSAVVTLHGQLFVRVPFAQLDV